MRSPVKYIIVAVLLILAQGALDNYVNISIYLDIAMCLYLLLALPVRWGTVPTMLAGFVIGLLVDILGNGILGMSAAAMTAAGLCRRGIFNLTAPKENEKRQSIETIGIRSFIYYSAPLTVIYLAVYILLDSSGFRPAGFCLARFGISAAVNTALMAFLYAISSDNRKRRMR